jgi:hypothetical protein
MFRKAERKKAKLRLGIAGASGSGKTWSALEIATGMGGKIAMIDTEAGRGELYGADFNYDVLRIEAPYSPDKYIQAIKAAEKAGYDILIIDSLSHAWAGDGGILSIVDNAGGNSFTSGWKTATPKHNALVDALITSNLHILVTMRSKTEYITEVNEKGRVVPKKVGLAPVQRDGMEYEFTMYMTMSQEHVAHITKDNTKLYDQQFVKPNQKMGADIMTWLNEGNDVAPSVNYIDEINKCKTIEALRSTFKEAYNAHGKEPIMFAINEAKDKRKLQLEDIQQ